MMCGQVKMFATCYDIVRQSSLTVEQSIVRYRFHGVGVTLQSSSEKRDCVLANNIRVKTQEC